MALRDKQRCLASDAVAYVRDQKSRNASKQRIAKERDLVVVRNHAVTARREKTGEEMVWASHLGFLHRIWLIGVRHRASRIWEDKEVSPKRPTLVQPSEWFQVEWYYYANISRDIFSYYWRTRRRRAGAKGSFPELATRILYCQGLGAI